MFGNRRLSSTANNPRPCIEITHEVTQLLLEVAKRWCHRFLQEVWLWGVGDTCDKREGEYSCPQEEDKALHSISHEYTLIHMSYQCKKWRGGKYVPAPTWTLKRKQYLALSVSLDPIIPLWRHTNIYHILPHSDTYRRSTSVHHERGGLNSCITGLDQGGCLSFTICSPHTQNKTLQENQLHPWTDEEWRAQLWW